MGSQNRVIQFNGQPVTGKRIEVYAHRAGRGLMPEHTLPAFKSALMLGVDYIDMDVHISKDDVLVITHEAGLNPDITRDANGKWISESILIKDLTVREIQKYNVGKIKQNTEYASYFPNQNSLEFAKIPTLKEVVQYVKKIAGDRVGFQIEIKNNPVQPEISATSEQYAKAVYKLLKEESIINRTEIQAFDWQCLIDINKLDPEIKTAYLTDHTPESLSENEQGTWMAGLKPKDFNYSFPKMIKHLGGYCWEPYEMDINKKDIKEAHKLGLKVVVWGWPEMEGIEFNYIRIKKLISWGVDGMIVDRPDILRGLLKDKGYSLPKGYTVTE